MRRQGSGSVLCLLLALLGASSLAAAPFASGDRVVLFGDSVTHWGFYTSQLQCFYYTRYPDRDVHILNCGVGGDTLGACLRRIDADVLARKPTVISVLFGANDVGVSGYTEGARQIDVQNRGRALGDFTNNLVLVKAALDKGGFRGSYLWCTPVPWDDELKFKTPRKSIRGVTAAEAGLAQGVRDFQRRNGGTLVELFDPMLAYNGKLHAKDPYASLTPDAIHPQHAGGLFIASCFLKAQGADGTVSDVTVDAEKGKVSAAKNATVTELATAADGTLSFTSLEKALPFPVDGPARALAADIWFGETLNRECLAVTGLADGDWTLKIDGRAVVAKSAADWAKGVNLSAFETPMMRQARAAADLNAERNAKEVSIRTLWLARSSMINNILCNAPASLYPSYADYDNPQVWKAYCIGFLRGNNGREHNLLSWYEEFGKKWGRRVELEAELEILHKRIRAACRPHPHRFELSRVK